MKKYLIALSFLFLGFAFFISPNTISYASTEITSSDFSTSISDCNLDRYYLINVVYSHWQERHPEFKDIEFDDTKKFLLTSWYEEGGFFSCMITFALPDEDFKLYINSGIRTNGSRKEALIFRYLPNTDNTYDTSSFNHLTLFEWSTPFESYILINPDTFHCIYSDIECIGNSGDTLNDNFNFQYTCDIKNKKVICTAKTRKSGNFKAYVEIYNRQNEPSEASLIHYKTSIQSTKVFNSTNPFYFEFTVQDYLDRCQDLKNFSMQIYLVIYVYGLEDNSIQHNSETYSLDLQNGIMDGESDDEYDDLFSHKKDYPEAPDISDFLDGDFPNIADYVDFHLFDDADSIGDYIIAIFKFLWSCLSGFFKWMWAVLKFIFYNLIGLFKYIGSLFLWLWDCLKVALYNLMVDLRRLIKFLFIPDSDKLNRTIDDKFPALRQVQGYMNSGKYNTSKVDTFSIFGIDFQFDTDSIPEKLRTTLYTFSTIMLRVFEVFFIIRMFFRIFGHDAEDKNVPD